MKADDEEIRKILAGIPDKFDILEDGIDFQTQMDYIEQSHAFDPGELTE